MKISKLNEVYLELDVDEDTSRELSDYFTFEVPGAKYMPHYRRKLWDGKIRLFSPHNGRIYVGLLPYIKEFCSRNSIEYIIEKELRMNGMLFVRASEILQSPYDPKVEGNLYNSVIIKLMQSGMLYKEIVVFCYVLLLRASH